MFGKETARFNSREYINWLKASYCLKLLKDGLLPFITHQMKGFHADLLSRNCRLKEPCKNFCRTRGTTLCSPCWTCEEWKKTILRHHRQKNVTLNWGNCSPPQWRTAYWELAKVVHHRNKLMHSAEFSAEDEWMTRYRRSLRNLAQQFSHVPEMENAGQQMEKVLNATFSVYVTDGEQSDSASELEVGVELISQWETEFLQERLQEVLRAAADGDRDDSETQGGECLKTLASFLHANADLSQTFSAELQAISSMEAEGSQEGNATKKLRTV
ncbi:uncharacterized protein CXorf38 homolog isoform X2 [Takifugu flavidus]|uniref:uncharacterized protein CXorf38 homolog isoform X2 n=1 Tax=Takifugu flavidus TaxID=433684 RepID=UPI0025446610|nr:uncharacterized protein CXorf38 homolog isoform X2 [Takifugu flavidus]